MSYNMDFLIAGLVFLALVLYHFSLQNRMADLSSRIFMGFIVIGILDILFDLISSVLIKMGNPEFQVVTNLSLIIFYLMQVFLPFGMFLYMRSLWLKEMDIRKGIARELFIPTATLAGLVLMNCWLHLFFKIDDGQYVRDACNAGDLGSIPGLGRSPGEGKGYPLQYSGLENSMDCIVHGVAKSQTRLSDFHIPFLLRHSCPQ